MAIRTRGRVTVGHGRGGRHRRGVRWRYGLGQHLLGELVQAERLALQLAQAGHQPGPHEQRLDRIGQPLGGTQHLA